MRCYLFALITLCSLNSFAQSGDDDLIFPSPGNGESLTLEQKDLYQRDKELQYQIDESSDWLRGCYSELRAAKKLDSVKLTIDDSRVRKFMKDLRGDKNFSPSAIKDLPSVVTERVALKETLARAVSAGLTACNSIRSMYAQEVCKAVSSRSWDDEKQECSLTGSGDCPVKYADDWDPSICHQPKSRSCYKVKEDSRVVMCTGSLKLGSEAGTYVKKSDVCKLGYGALNADHSQLQEGCYEDSEGKLFCSTSLGEIEYVNQNTKSQHCKSVDISEPSPKRFEWWNPSTWKNAGSSRK